MKVLESYLVRRTVCGRPTKAYNRVFPGLLKRLSDAEMPASALVAGHLKNLASGEKQDWPDDVTFQKAWLNPTTYKALRAAKTKMLLEALELGSRNEAHQGRCRTSSEVSSGLVTPPSSRKVQRLRGFGESGR